MGRRYLGYSLHQKGFSQNPSQLQQQTPSTETCSALLECLPSLLTTKTIVNRRQAPIVGDGDITLEKVPYGGNDWFMGWGDLYSFSKLSNTDRHAAHEPVYNVSGEG